MKRSGVYLLHFDRPLEHAQHYLGFADDIDARIERHRAGNGSKLVRAALDAGIGFRLVRVWEGMDRNGERKLKKRKNGCKLCPLCMGKEQCPEN